MKNRILFFVLLFTVVAGNFNQAWAQLRLDIANNNYKVSVNNMPPIIAPGDIRIVSDSSYTGDKKRTLLWCEYGDGGFTTDSLSITNRRAHNKYNTLMLAATIYDTTRDGLAKFSHFNYVGQNRDTALSDNDEPLTHHDSTVAITPSMGSIVPGDSMVFAITYKLPVPDKSPLPPPDKDSTGTRPPGDGKELSRKPSPGFMLVFLYNDSIFGKLESNKSINVGGAAFSSVRTAHYEEPSFIKREDILAIIPDAKSYNSHIFFTIKDSLRTTESNVFVTLRPGDSILLGSTGSVKAVLIQIDSNNGTTALTIAGEATITGMPIARAHDPNYINQEKRCITTPKDHTTLSYHIHFQNDGKGIADTVIVKVALPYKARFNGLIFIKASIGNNRNYKLTPREDKNSDSVIFTFDRNFLLYGTDNNANDFSNPNTMGDIFFTVKTNSEMPDTIYSRAAIYFHSRGADWEKPVYTAVAVSYFTKCCSCSAPHPPPPPTPGCKTLLYLCWWWWILIAIGIIITWWLIARKRKRKKDELPRY